MVCRGPEAIQCLTGAVLSNQERAFDMYVNNLRHVFDKDVSL